MTRSALGPYRLDRELGSGGMGKVYAATAMARARAVSEGAQVALKIVHPHLFEAAGFFKRFLREAEIGRSVHHPNVVRTLDCDALLEDEANVHFLVMELVEGQTLRDLQDELGTVPEELCRHIGREVARGLEAIHAAGAIHRDLKPENVLITPDHVVKVMDLGVARLLDEAARLSETGSFVGSLHYAAPESFRDGAEEVDGRVDLHALGLVLYELSSGVNPYLADDVRSIVHRVLHEEPRRLGDLNSQLSPFFEEVVHTLLAKERAERFPTATELLRVLEDGESSTWWAGRVTAIRETTRRPLRRIRIPRETAVYGREDELAGLRELFGQAAAGEGRVVLIEGEAGIGKSRLVDELAATLRTKGVDLDFLFGEFPPGGSATSAGAFATAFAEHLGDGGSAEYLADALLLVPAFDALLAGQPAPPDAVPLGSDALQTAFAHVTRALAAERPVVLLIDDLHFAPDEGRALFASLARIARDTRLLLIGTARPGLPADWTAALSRLDHTVRMELGRLGAKDLVRLLHDAFQSERLAESLAGRIAVKSDGNPLFVFEIVQGLRDGGMLRREEDGSWSTTGRIDEIAIPSSVQDLVNARVADLEEEQRDLLEVAACCGFQFDPSVVAAAVDEPFVPTLKRLGRIEKRHRLIRSAGREYVFDHHQVREAIYEGLHPQLREHYHGAVADVLAERAGDGLPEGDVAVALAEHLIRAGRAGIGAQVEHAVEQLVANWSVERAQRLFELAIDAPNAVTPQEHLRMLWRIYMLFERFGTAEQEEAHVDRAIRVAEACGDDGERARWLCQLGFRRTFSGRIDEAPELLTQAIELARAAGAVEVEAFASGNVANVRCFLEGPEAALEGHRRQRDLARRCGSRRAEMNALANVGLIHLRLGACADARRELEAARALAVEMGHSARAALWDMELAAVDCVDLRGGDAVRSLDTVIATARQLGDRQLESWSQFELATVYTRLGLWERSEEAFDRTVTLVTELGDRVNAQIARVEQMLALLASGTQRQVDVEPLETDLIEAFPESALSVAQLDHATGRVDAAVGRWRRAAEQARSGGRPDLRARALCSLLALEACSLEEAEQAMREFEASRDPLGRMDALFQLWQAGGSAEYLREAKRILEQWIGNAPEEHRECTRSVPLHRDILDAAHAAGLD